MSDIFEVENILYISQAIHGRLKNLRSPLLLYSRRCCETCSARDTWDWPRRFFWPGFCLSSADCLATFVCVCVCVWQSGKLVMVSYAGAVTSNHCVTMTTSVTSLRSPISSPVVACQSTTPTVHRYFIRSFFIFLFSLIMFSGWLHCHLYAIVSRNKRCL